MSMNKRRSYLPPTARDLSGGIAVGDEYPMGQCAAGPTPYYNCVTGTAFIGPCPAGSTPDTSYCNPGGVHAFPACKTGVFAVTACMSGQGQNF